MNAIMYLVKTGCQWRMLPKDFPPYNTVFYCFDRWKWEGVFEELMETLRVEVRRLAGREDSPSLGIIDSRSVKSSHHVDADRGIDGNKKIKGRKEIAQKLRVQFYFARPYHSWERGANENTNGLIRQYIPKGTDFSTLTDEFIAEVEWKLNNRPRKTLGYLTPLEYFKKMFNF